MAEARNAQVRLMQAVRYAVEVGGTKREVRELVESALAEYDDFGASLYSGPGGSMVGVKRV